MTPVAATEPGQPPDSRFDAIGTICSPGVSHEEAIGIFRAAYERDPAIDARLLAYARGGEQEWLPRVLRVLGRVSSGKRLVASLLPLLDSHDPSIRAEAVALIARARPNAAWALEMLNDKDPRVRANVVEAARGYSKDRDLIDRALKDSHHRVVCNAIVSLHIIAPEAARAALLEVARRPDPAFRAAAAWACGAIGDPELVDLLRQMRSDPDRSVRWNALRSLTAIQRQHRPDDGGAGVL